MRRDTDPSESSPVQDTADANPEKEPGTQDPCNDTLDQSRTTVAATQDPNQDVEKNETQEEDTNLPFSKGKTIALVLTLTGAAFLNTLSNQASVIILPTIGKDLDIPNSRQQWILSSYSLAFGCFLLLWGRLADVYGKRGVFIYGSAFVCVTTLVCPFVPDEIGFNVMRGLQGLGAAANVPTAIGILGVTFKPGKAKNYAFSTYSSGAPLGAVFGNIFSGVVAQYVSWHWVFWILAILAALVTVAGFFLVPTPAVDPSEVNKIKGAVDWIGGTLITVSLFILLFALTEGNISGWNQGYIIAVIVVSIALLAAFVAWRLYLEKKTSRRPLLKVTIFKNGRVSAAMGTMACCSSAFFNFLVFITYFWQEYRGFSPLQTTLRFIPLGPFGILASFITAKLLARVKVNYLALASTLFVATAILLMTVPIPPKTTYWALGFPSACISTLGADSLFPALFLFNAHSLPKEDQAMGGALINAVSQVGRSIFLAIAIAIQVAVQSSHEKKGAQRASSGSGEELNNPAYLKGLQAGLWFNFGLAITAAGIVLVAFRGAGIMGGKKQ